MVRKPDYWDSSEGAIIRAIVLGGAFTKNEIIKKTGLTEEQFEAARNESIKTGLLTEIDDNAKLWVNSRQLFKEYQEFFTELQERIINFVCEWRIKKRLRGSLNHFFLDGELLDELSRKLIKIAYLDVLVANPYVDRCNLSRSLIKARENGTCVRLVTRHIANQYNKERMEKCHSELQQEGVSITYEDSIHAKLITIDRAVAIVSSMNFIASSSGGAACEAGIVSVEPDVVLPVTNYILDQL